MHACVACSKSKRRCSKQLPACRRCHGKGLRCEYPLVRIVAASDASAPSGNPNTDTPSSIGSLSQENSPLSIQAQSLGTPDPPVNLWFLAPSSWDIQREHGNLPVSIAYPDSGLRYFVDRLRAWVSQWTLGQHSNFIHSHLYGGDMPESLQHAYAAFQAYQHSTNTNKHIALQIVRSYTKLIIQDQTLCEGFSGGAYDIRSHLSRTQALLIFQLIRLFDGDIRSRAEAESTTATLMQWVNSLMEKTKADLEAGTRRRMDQLHPFSTTSELHCDGTPASLWRAWIFSESIRRTWIIAGLMEAAFSILKEGHSPCPGSICFTGTKGLWEAASPKTWTARMQDAKQMRFRLSCADIVNMLDEGKPSDFDEFTRLLLVYGQGLEKCPEWCSTD
uniref:Zn(2)-C6 fungal-type domain-containing protein n=1 Tax=Bionectria ochroleuca TaxID=29856 RepID=A0A8H7KCU6_BIOOC